MTSKGPTPADIIDECDTSGNGMLSKDEVHACIAEHVPAEHQDEANEMVDKMWDHVDKNGDGEIDEHELSKAMRGGPPKKLAQLMKKGKGKKGGKGKGSDSEGSGSDSASGSESEGDALAQKKGKGKGKKGGKGSDSESSGSDSDASGSESEGEALVQKKGKGKGKKGGKGSDSEGSGSDSEASGSESEGEALVQKKGGKKGKGKKDKGSDSESSGSDSESDAELVQIQRRRPKHEDLAQLKKGGKGPSAKDIIDACDGNGSGGIDLEEAHACIDAHISDPEMNKEAHDMVDEGFEHVDKNGDGEIDEHELSKAMKAHK